MSLAMKQSAIQRIPRQLRTAAHHSVQSWNAASITRTVPADIYHVVDGSHGYIAHWLPPARTIITAHDLIPELQAQGRFDLPPPRRLARWVIQSSLNGLKRATRIMAVSQSTANDLEAFARIDSSKIDVVPHPLAPEIVPARNEPAVGWNERRNRGNSFMLHLGNNGFYKNRSGVVRVFDQVRRMVPIRLTLAGPRPDASLRKLIHELQLDSLIDFVIDPDDADIAALYRSARLFLFPSLYEGFGWPPLEAMASSCPVVCSSGGSLPEVVGDAAFIADPHDEDQLARHCLSILNSQSAADELVAAGKTRIGQFTLERFQSQILANYEAVTQAHNCHSSALSSTRFTDHKTIPIGAER
ncbi:MAG: glycosyltransferase family 4 protein [Planctomycetes bacterium]|nr:glycosyltransferase family 4 protein [Planctomycetota bacterium]